MSYKPPSPSNWHYTHTFRESYKDAYDEGYQAAKENKSLKDNPYEESGYERDTTYWDELHYKGFNEYSP